MRWLSRWILLDLDLEAGDVDGAASHAAALLAPPQALPPEDLEDVLARCGETDDPRELLSDGVIRARALGYL